MRKCRECGKDLSREHCNKIFCDGCVKKHASLRAKQYIKKKRELGICITCTVPAYKGGYCEKHYKQVLKRGKKWRKNNPGADRKKASCRIIYVHDKEMKDDPNALTTEFMEKMLGVSCKKLKK